MLDGASTDATPEIMREFCAKHGQIKYYRVAIKGGIDRDMAKVVELSSATIAGSSAAMTSSMKGPFDRAQRNPDRIRLYLCKHMECFKDMRPLHEHPVLEPDVPGVFQLSDPGPTAQIFQTSRQFRSILQLYGRTDCRTCGVGPCTA